MPGYTQDVQRPLESHQMAQQTDHAVTAADTLDPDERWVNVTAPESSSYAITLAPACRWAGKETVLYCTGTAGSGEVSVSANAGDLTTLTLGDNMSAAGDFVILRSNGRFVYTVAEVTT